MAFATIQESVFSDVILFGSFSRLHQVLYGFFYHLVHRLSSSLQV